MHWFLRFIFGIKLYMFRTVPLSIIGSFSLYTQHCYMSYRFAGSLRAGSQAASKPVWHITMLHVQWKTPDDGQRNCPKHVEFYSKNKSEKSVHLVGYIIKLFHDAQSPELQTVYIHIWHCTMKPCVRVVITVVVITFKVRVQLILWTPWRHVWKWR